MSLTAAKMKGSLKDQLADEEVALKAELAAVEQDKVRAAKKEKVSQKDD
jgi:hypothetical protein